MKQIKTLLIAAILILGANQTISAQAKTAHVDVNDVMAKMPAMLDAQKQLEKISSTYDADYKKMAEEFKAKLAKYDAEAATVSEANFLHAAQHLLNQVRSSCHAIASLHIFKMRLYDFQRENTYS